LISEKKLTKKSKFKNYEKYFPNYIDNTMTLSSKTMTTSKSTSDAVVIPTIAENFPDKIASLILNQCKELLRKNRQYSARKVLAGIVMTINSNIDTAKVCKNQMINY
jgi:hypothetical protein